MGAGGRIRGIYPNNVEDVPSAQRNAQIFGYVGPCRCIHPSKIVRLAHDGAIRTAEYYLGPARVF